MLTLAPVRISVLVTNRLDVVLIARVVSSYLLDNKYLLPRNFVRIRLAHICALCPT